MSNIYRAGVALAYAMLGMAFAGYAGAEDTSAEGLQEVIVTAQKVAQEESKVPLAVSVMTGADLSQRNYQSLDDFKGSVPGLQVNDYVGEARINIRGIGENSLSFGVDSQVAYNFNGVYVSSSFAADEAFLDVNRIEVLRRSAGTLYGRNATGGAINVITNMPTDKFEAMAQLSYGNYQDFGTRGVISGPLRPERHRARSIGIQHRGSRRLLV